MKKKFTFIIIQILCVSTGAQTMKIPIQKYHFARFEQNNIIFPSDSSRFEYFFTKLDTLLFFGKGKIDILHMGGSHIQAGILTQQFRSNMLNLSPGIEGGRGFVFPYVTAKTNNPPSYDVHFSGKWTNDRSIQQRLHKPLGLSGISISSNDTNATVSILTKKIKSSTKIKSFTFNRVRILGYASNDSIVPILQIDKKKLFAQTEKKSFSYIFNLPQYTDSICIGLQFEREGYFTITGILLENDLPGISCHEIGINGASLTSYLKCIMLENDISLLHPDLVILGIGVNDANNNYFSQTIFMRRYDQLIQKIRQAAPKCAILFITNNDCFIRSKSDFHANANSILAQKAFMQMSEKYQAGVWDLFYIMGGLSSITQWEHAGLAKQDRVHFTRKGYMLLGDLLYNALIDKYLIHLNTIQ